MTQHAISDERARKAIERLRNVAVPGSETHALMMYVAERLPRIQKPARTVQWSYHGDGLGSLDTIFEHDLPNFLRDQLARGDLRNFSFGQQFQKDVR